jgi:hypothetical protein
MFAAKQKMKPVPLVNYAVGDFKYGTAVSQNVIRSSLSFAGPSE